MRTISAQSFRLHAALGFAAVVIPSANVIASPAPAFIVRDVRLFDGHRVQEHRSLFVRAARIVMIGGPKLKVAGVQIISGVGKTLLPGIIDAHVHVAHANTESALIQSARLGVTTVLDLFTDQQTLKRIKQFESSDSVGMADIRSAGVGATVPRGHPTEMGGPSIPTLSSPKDAPRFIDARITEGSDFIKIILEDGSELGLKGNGLPTLNETTLRALVRAARARGKLVVVHAQTEGFARMAINAGADGLAHIFIGKTVSNDFGRFVAAHHAFVIPTLTAEYSWCGRSNGRSIATDKRLMSQTYPEFTRTLSLPTQPTKLSCDGTDHAVRELRDAGVRILVGTDAAFPGSTYGASTLDEMALLVADGLTPTQALIAGTSAPAKAFRLNDRGTIAVGKRADLLLVEGDPTTNIDSIKNIVGVWKRGIPVNRLSS